MQFTRQSYSAVVAAWLLGMTALLYTPQVRGIEMVVTMLRRYFAAKRSVVQSLVCSSTNRQLPDDDVVPVVFAEEATVVPEDVAKSESPEVPEETHAGVHTSHVAPLDLDSVNSILVGGHVCCMWFVFKFANARCSQFPKLHRFPSVQSAFS